VEGKEGVGEKGGEMTQTLYAHMNKRKKKDEGPEFKPSSTKTKQS
jgi:hypothetical protein